MKIWRYSWDIVSKPLLVEPWGDSTRQFVLGIIKSKNGEFRKRNNHFMEYGGLKWGYLPLVGLFHGKSYLEIDDLGVPQFSRNFHMVVPYWDIVGLYMITLFLLFFP